MYANDININETLRVQSSTVLQGEYDESEFAGNDLAVDELGYGPDRSLKKQSQCQNRPYRAGCSKRTAPAPWLRNFDKTAGRDLLGCDWRSFALQSGTLGS